MDSTQEGNSGNLQTITHMLTFVTSLIIYLSSSPVHAELYTKHVNIHRCVYVIIIEPMHLPML